jgi:PilZ domain
LLTLFNGGIVRVVPEGDIFLRAIGRSLELLVCPNNGTSMNTDEEKYYRTLREYSRVDAFLPVHIRVVEKEEVPTLRSRTALESAIPELKELPEPEDKVLAECLHILNAKLDTILKILAFQNSECNTLCLRQINISAGGLCVSTNESFETGSIVEIRLMLPSAPYVVYYVYGEVVKSELVGDIFENSIMYTEIDEDIREQIAKYVFERQREILRKKRRP